MVLCIAHGAEAASTPSFREQSGAALPIYVCMGQTITLGGGGVFVAFRSRYTNLQLTSRRLGEAEVPR